MALFIGTAPTVFVAARFSAISDFQVILSSWPIKSSTALQGVSTVSEAAISGARDSRAIIFRQAREKGISGFEECDHWRAASLTVLTPCRASGVICERFGPF